MLGMGASTQQAKWSKALQIVLAWVTTVPIAAAFAAAVYWMMAWFLG
jgi:phosphate/sulfate permease